MPDLQFRGATTNARTIRTTTQQRQLHKQSHNTNSNLSISNLTYYTMVILDIRHSHFAKIRIFMIYLLVYEREKYLQNQHHNKHHNPDYINCSTTICTTSITITCYFNYNSTNDSTCCNFWPIYIALTHDHKNNQ